MTKQNSKQSTADATPDKTRPNQPLVPLTEAQLEAIAGDAGCPIWSCGHNHNETLVNGLNL